MYARFLRQTSTLSLHDALPICNTRAAAALLGLEEHRERNFVRPCADRVEVVEGPGARCRHAELAEQRGLRDRKSTRLNSSHLVISYVVFCMKRKKCRLFAYCAG